MSWVDLVAWYGLNLYTITYKFRPEISNKLNQVWDVVLNKVNMIYVFCFPPSYSCIAFMQTELALQRQNLSVSQWSSYSPDIIDVSWGLFARFWYNFEEIHFCVWREFMELLVMLIFYLSSVEGKFWGHLGTDQLQGTSKAHVDLHGALSKLCGPWNLTATKFVQSSGAAGRQNICKLYSNVSICGRCSQQCL